MLSMILLCLIVALGWWWCYPLLPRDGGAEEFRWNQTVGPRHKVWIRDQTSSFPRSPINWSPPIVQL